jgi:REP element-mobilizing transposase RayT
MMWRISPGLSVSDMRSRLYVHVVWTTRDRQPLLDANVARFLTRFLRGVARQERAQVLEVGMVSEHLHLLARVDASTRLPRLLQRWKGGSATIANKEGHCAAGRPLRWSKGYTIQSVSPQSLAAVRTYVRAQSQHHPDRAIPDWQGDDSEYDAVGGEQWQGSGRARLLARRADPDKSVH